MFGRTSQLPVFRAVAYALLCKMLHRRQDHSTIYTHTRYMPYNIKDSRSSLQLMGRRLGSERQRCLWVSMLQRATGRQGVSELVGVLRQQGDVQTRRSPRSCGASDSERLLAKRWHCMQVSTRQRVSCKQSGAARRAGWAGAGRPALGPRGPASERWVGSGIDLVDKSAGRMERPQSEVRGVGGGLRRQEWPEGGGRSAGLPPFFSHIQANRLTRVDSAWKRLKNIFPKKSLLVLQAIGNCSDYHQPYSEPQILRIDTIKESRVRRNACALYVTN